MKKVSPDKLRLADFCLGLEFPVGIAVSSLSFGRTSIVPSPQQLKEIYDDSRLFFFCIGFAPGFVHQFWRFRADYTLPNCNSKVTRRQIKVLRVGLRLISNSKYTKAVLPHCCRQGHHSSGQEEPSRSKIRQN